MKKPIRGILMVSFVALIVGIGLVIAGVVAGATWQDAGNAFFSGKYSIGKSTFIGIGANWKSQAVGDKLSGEDNVLKEVDAKKVERLTIRIFAGELDIKEGKSDYFQVNNKENRGNCFVEYSDNELTITFEGNKHGKGAKATLWIPEGLSIDEVEVRVDAGKITVDTLEATNLMASVGAGQLITKDIQATTVDIEVDAGEFKSGGEMIADKVALRVAAGAIKVNLIDTKDADLNVAAGSISATFAGQESDYRIDANCDIGRIKIGGESYHVGKDYKSWGEASGRVIVVECSVGEAEINFKR